MNERKIYLNVMRGIVKNLEFTAYLMLYLMVYLRV